MEKIIIKKNLSDNSEINFFLIREFSIGQKVSCRKAQRGWNFSQVYNIKIYFIIISVKGLT
jgi:hypothetical protein